MVVITALASALVVALAVGLTGARALQSHRAGAAASSLPAHTVAAPSIAATSASLAGRTWRLVAFTDQGNAQTLTRNATITLVFDPAHHALGGRAGCNGYGGYYALSADHLRLDGIGYTQMRCFSDRVMAQEARYLEAFPHATSVHLDATGLTLSDATGAYVLRFV